MIEDKDVESFQKSERLFVACLCSRCLEITSVKVISICVLKVLTAITYFRIIYRSLHRFQIFSANFYLRSTSAQQEGGRSLMNPLWESYVKKDVPGRVAKRKAHQTTCTFSVLQERKRIAIHRRLHYISGIHTTWTPFLWQEETNWLSILILRWLSKHT